MRLDQLFKEDDTTVKTMSMPEKVAAFDRLQPGQEVGLWFDSVIRRADKYKPFIVGRKTKSKLRPLEKITLLQKSKDGGTGGMKYYLYKRADNTSFQNANVSLAMGDMAASLVDIKESRAFIDLDESIKEATIMERIVLDIDYSRNPEALVKAINLMGKRLDLTLMNAPQALDDLKQKGFARIEGKDSDIMSFVNYLYSKGIEPNYNIQNMDKVQTPGLNKNKAMPAFIGKKEVPVEEGMMDDEVKAILMKYPKELAKLKASQDLMDVYDTPLYQELFSYYADSGEMPYGTMKARDGDPVQFIQDELDDMGVFEGFASDAQRKAAFASGYDPKKKKKVKEDAPFDGMGLVQRMVFNKWISIDEWNVLKDKFKDAAQEIEANYDDWPEGEGFGSSDHNFAIKELMEILGYKFDNEDRSGKFIVTDVPQEVKNAGLRNIRQKDPDPIIASEGYSNERHQAQTMLKLEELRDMIMVLDMDDDSKTSALTALDQVADDITILESKDGANTSDGKHQEKICRDTVRNPNKSMLGGPSPEEAEKTLKSKFGYSDEKISKLKEEFEPHKMYKDGKVKMANTHADHVKLGKQGWSHDNPKTKKIEEKEKNCGCGQTPCKTYGKKIEEQAPHTHPITEAEFDEAAGEKDACYHKVKSRYKVWPSAYASGALVKCRKVGAKNWGNSKKK